MLFKKFMLQPLNEYALFTRIAYDVQSNFSTYHGQYYYLHLTPAGEQKSHIHKIQNFLVIDNPWYYTYIEHEKQPCIILKTDGLNLAMLLYGEYLSAEIQITPIVLTTVWGPSESTLPWSRKNGMSNLEKMKAFGLIHDSLNEFKRNKA